LAALIAFFDTYFEFADQPFFITGESYAGHYIPTLVDAILTSNQQGLSDINLVGFAVGNPTTNLVIK
jgi:carboxypeptidase C (cathepsin A)